MDLSRPKRLIFILWLSFGLWALPSLGSARQTHAQKNLWVTMRPHLTLGDYDHRPTVQHYIQWYQKHSITLNRRLRQASPYINYVYQQVKQKNLPPELTLLPFIESTYDPYAYSTEGAAGLWQLMPRTGTVLGIKHTWWYEGRRDIEASTEAALTYLARLNKAFHGNWLLTIAAYDSGGGTVRSALRKNRKRGKGTDFWSLPLPRETQHYIPKLLALASLIKYPKKYGVTLPPIQEAPLLGEVNIPIQLDLIHIANMANLPLQKVQKLNPGYTRWATDPNRKNHLLLPLNKIAIFKTRLATLPKSKKIIWRHHIVEAGDSLIKIAKQYNTSVDLLKQANKLPDHHIKIGAFLLIPENANTLLKEAHTGYSQSVLWKQSTIHRMLHEVKPGESLWSIAKRYRLSVKKLKEWNEVKDPNTIRAGETIILWSKTAIGPGLKGHLQHEILTRYVTQPGDTLSFIAFYFDSTPEDIRLANGLTSQDIESGQVLIIPAGTLSLQKNHTSHKKAWRKVVYHVRTGDSLYSIGKKFHVDSVQIALWNHLDELAILKPGTKLVLHPA